jgi:DNA polymerase-3 subunit epsilon
MSADFVAIDFETTGLSPNSPHSHRVIEIGIVRFSLENGISAEYESVINPQRDIGPFEIHRISAGEASGAPTFAEVASDVAEILNGARLIAHNKNFDLRFLRSELDRASITYADLDAICTMELVGMIKPKGPRRLTDCCELLGIEVLDAHRALNDAKMAANIAISVLNSTGFPALTNPVEIHGPFQVSSPAVKRGESVPKTVSQGSYLRQVMDGLTHQELPINRIGLAVAEYLNLLELVLEDRRIDQSEADELFDLADRLLIPKSQLGAIHATYFTSICERALADGSISTEEEFDLQSLANLLNVGDWREIVNVSSARIPNHTTPIRIAAGTTVCFTGTMKYPRQKCLDIVTAAGLVNVDRVTKSLDILVVADSDSQSTKAMKAKKYGLRILSATAFFELIGDVAYALTEEPESISQYNFQAIDDQPFEDQPIEVIIAIGGRDIRLYEAGDAINTDVIMAKYEIAELLTGLPSLEFQVSELQSRVKGLREALPNQTTLSQLEIDIAPQIRDVLTDIYVHLQFLRGQSHVVTREVQFQALSLSESVVESLAMFSLIPTLPNFQKIPLEIWPQFMLEQIDRILRNLQPLLIRLTASEFLIAESKIDFSDSSVMTRLQNCSIVITGSFADFSREEGRGAILRRGGKSPSSISGKTYALITGDQPGGAKVQQAIDAGVQILTAGEFRTLLDEGPGKTFQEVKQKISTKPKASSENEYETLTCVICDSQFTRLRVKGRKPHNCPNCNF